MLSTSPVNSAALLILRQVSASSTPGNDNGSTATSLVAAANGVPDPDDSGASNVTAKAKGKISEALFSSTPNLQEIKVGLYRQLGDAFGISFDDAKSASEFASSVRAAIGKLKTQSGGDLALKAIEQKLGLDKLGITLDTLVNAIDDPDGDDAHALDGALRQSLGLGAKDADDRASQQGLSSLVSAGDDGLYGR
jgi:hypothetical protein